MDKAKLEKIVDKVRESKFFKNYGYGTTLIYDCYHPECNCIEIDLKCDTLRGINRSLDKLVREIGVELVSKHYLCKYDGSCPDAAKIYFK